ncbi:hypothetical protein [Legionella spiritensis]|uniref:Queuine tRNA-ribosyltransferase n=1 Tax=Legionella spiritensis TaxID=452 RepID=A0A0W0Z9I2_LEGSP|nr:hypothetical protein [Legionella spiritensis]KTD65705.1 queuine tRNA-ribosyltransferase [Legionella spiritensis]SNV43386.1 queuine tRNA-ribosyltransferase [Legionella spiritensis]
MQEQPLVSQFVPVLTSDAGSCLTVANWLQAGIYTAAFYLEELLMKPGKDVLLSLPDLRSHYAWPGTVVLNAVFSVMPKEGEYRIHSRYDGQRITVDVKTLFLLITQLKPDYVVLSQQDYERFECLRLRLPAGVFLETVKETGKKTNRDEPRIFNYLNPPRDETAADESGSLLYSRLDTFQFDSSIPRSNGTPLWLETDKPAADGMKGCFYHHEGIGQILDAACQEQFQALDEQCPCLTCTDGYTRAYLHHLLMNTPLLAQRFLIRHNVGFFQRYIRAC